MASKNVFRPTEITNVAKIVYIQPPESDTQEIEETEPVEEYTGPTADDLRREAEIFRVNWEREKEELLLKSEAEAQKIIKDAEDAAFEELNSKNNEALKIKQQAEDEAARIVREAKEHADRIIEDSEKKIESLEGEAYESGFSKGNEEGFVAGSAEVERLVAQLHSIINSAIARRNEIIEESETQIINLVLLIAVKVIKVISENQKNVVVNNVIQALRKLKTRGDVVVRVNLEDVKIASDRIQDFMRMVENVNSVTIVEDSTVDRGGCIIETDFGEIDARISSQLREIEDKILELMPIKVKQEKT